MNKKGLTLIEIIITVALLGMISLLFLSIFANGHRLISRSGSQSKSLIESQDDIETLIASQGPGTLYTYQMDFSGRPSMTVDGVIISDGTFATFLPGVSSLSIPVTGVLASETDLLFTSLGELQLVSVNVLPSDASNKNVSWTTGNGSIAGVSGGVVQAVNYGSTVITVTTDDGGFTDTINVVVSSVVQSSDSSLIALNFNGSSVDGFSPTIFTYNQNGVGDDVPVVTATANHPSATIVITPATNTTGQAVDRTTTVVVTAEDGSKTTYSIVFKKGGN